MTTPNVEGESIRMGGDTYVVPALSLGQMKKLREEIETLRKKDADENELQGAATKVIHAALSRNYPDLILEQVESLVDLRNLPQVLGAIMGQSGFALGKVMALQARLGSLGTPTSTGNGSMESSSPPSQPGPGST
jgi:hypothetical protein